MFGQYDGNVTPDGLHPTFNLISPFLLNEDNIASEIILLHTYEPR
jgi:hypothetical protein